jgi:GNAT superfamily N-acetyltransferase
MTTARSLEVELVGDELAPALSRFAERLPLQYNDFASIALLRPEEPRVWAAHDGGDVVAAAIDDGLAMSVAGDASGLAVLAEAIPDTENKLVIAGRNGELGSFVQGVGGERRIRREHFMSVGAQGLRQPPEPIPLRVAEESDLHGDLYTDPSMRGAGRATRALTAFCSWLLTESRNVTLRVGQENEPAVRLYQRVGFTVLDAFESSLRADT